MSEALDAVSRALEQRAAARAELERALRALEDPAERRAGLQLARGSGLSAIKLAELAGVSRARMYQLLG